MDRRALLLLLPLLAASGCGDEPAVDPTPTSSTPAATLDTSRVERAIRKSIKDQRSVAAKVTCPSDIEQAKGVNFVCVVTTDAGQTEFAVLQVDDAGNVTYTARDESAPAP